MKLTHRALVTDGSNSIATIAPHPLTDPRRKEGTKMTMRMMAVTAMLAFAGIALAGYADDRAEIENLSNRYMVAVDAGDIEGVMATWAEDGVLDSIFGVQHGKAKIREIMSRFGGGNPAAYPADATSRPRTRHQIINHVIDVKGDTAKTIAYWFALTNRTPQKDVQLLYFGHYEDELVKVGGKWLFKKRTVYNESQHNRALFYPGLNEKDPRRPSTGTP